MAISYDEPDALAAFAEGNNIGYPLLSDPDSEIIRSFGILNTLIPEDDHPWHGIPFPGVYIVDADGIITDKFFESHFALRPGSDQLIRAVKGEQVHAELGQAPTTAPESVSCEIELDLAPAAPGTLRELRVHLGVPEGQHLYGGPVPEGMVATSVTFDDVEGLIVLDAKAPPTRPLTLAGTGETLNVWDGDVVLRVPITYSAMLAGSGSGDGVPMVSVAGRVHWQACDDEVCGLPQSQEFAFELPVKAINRPSARRTDGGGDGMDTRAFLKAMVERRS